jgi:hypothetical protein
MFTCEKCSKFKNIQIQKMFKFEKYSNLFTFWGCSYVKKCSKFKNVQISKMFNSKNVQK